MRQSHPVLRRFLKKERIAQMNYVIFDLEWNQPMSASETVKEPLYLSGEIIEIGAVKLDEQFRLRDELKLYIKPQYYTRMNDRVVALTGIKNQHLAAKGVPFPEAFDRFLDWCGEDFAFMTWSMSDIPMLADNMLLHGIDASELPVCYDIQRIFGREIMRSEVRYSLDYALEILQEKGDTAHDALHDARNTAKICDRLDLNEYLEEYGSKVFAEAPRSRVYESCGELLADAELREFTCPWCGETVTCEDFLQSGNGTYMAYGLCAEEDEFLLQLSAVKHQPGEYRAKRLLFEMSDDLWDIYMDKKEAAERQ